MEAEEEPHVVLAEAGTGVGKTLGYIAPASLWAERNEGTVWLSTFTRNLQRQIDRELDRLYPEAKAKAEKVVLRKGRENYLCLLNMEEALGRSALVPAERIALGLMARWAAGDARRRPHRRRPAGLARRPARLRPAPSGSPTGAASASTTPAPTTAAASSRRANARRGGPTS